MSLVQCDADEIIVAVDLDLCSQVSFEIGVQRHLDGSESARHLDVKL